ncbi:hypothetical protein WDV94_05000 [Clavibacter tessellarius]
MATIPHVGEFTFFDDSTGRVYGSRVLESDTEPADPELAEIWRESARFGVEGPRDFIRGRADVPLREYLDANGYSRAFQEGYIVRLSTAVWSVPYDLIWDMPAATVIAYFVAHGNSSLGGRGVGWETVAGGSRRYVDAALAAAGADVRLSTPSRASPRTRTASPSLRRTAASSGSTPPSSRRTATRRATCSPRPPTDSAGRWPASATRRAASCSTPTSASSPPTGRGGRAGTTATRRAPTAACPTSRGT